MIYDFIFEQKTFQVFNEDKKLVYFGDFEKKNIFDFNGKLVLEFFSKYLVLNKSYFRLLNQNQEFKITRKYWLFGPLVIFNINQEQSYIFYFSMFSPDFSVFHNKKQVAMVIGSNLPKNKFKILYEPDQNPLVFIVPILRILLADDEIYRSKYGMNPYFISKKKDRSWRPGDSE